MAADRTDPIERWTAKRRVALVGSLLKGETSMAEAVRTHGLTVAEVEDWREQFL
jgi:transposase-like protein